MSHKQEVTEVIAALSFLTQELGYVASPAVLSPSFGDFYIDFRHDRSFQLRVVKHRGYYSAEMLVHQEYFDFSLVFRYLFPGVVIRRDFMGLSGLKELATELRSRLPQIEKKRNQINPEKIHKYYKANPAYNLEWDDSSKK